jgi:hypothetical protein
MVSHREACRRRGFCYIDERIPLIEERARRRMRLYDHFIDVRQGWRASRQAARHFSNLVRTVTGIRALARLVSQRKRTSLAD